MLTLGEIRIIDALGTHPYVRELTQVASPPSVIRWLKEMDDMGLVEEYVEREGVGRPRIRYRLSRQGLKLATLLNEMRYHMALYAIKKKKIPSLVGVLTSLTDCYHVPLVLPWKDIAVLEDFEKKAEKIIEKIAGGSNWKVEVMPVAWEDFTTRSVEKDDLFYLGLEDTIVLAILKEEARTTSCLPRVIYNNHEKLDHNLLFELVSRTDRIAAKSTKFPPVDRVRGAAFGKLGAILEISNRLAMKELVPRSFLNKLGKRVPKRELESRVIYTHRFTKMGLIPFKENPTDKEVRERWRVRMPTFQEIREVWDLAVR